ncbi:hypothetical protein J2X46_003888 [Nocardioides sp. BE266]|uniref:hypothetical protein n=1 Tax=Nocardioides sp. BE266 TaxID=2817725 RepID=UPI0028569CAA|nr:hypothetical protein [Nocardioides sp. BE266]MDR7254890.1 hypothetical protein [Nocardioides sp. BE266]
MTHDTQLRERLTAAVDGTTVPPGLSAAALSGGRARRRRRTAAGVALAVAAVVGGAMLLPGDGPRGSDGHVADDGAGIANGRVGISWARSLPEGAAPGLPFFGQGGALWSDGRRVDVPASVNRTVPPRTVADGWLVMTGDDETGLALSLLGADGSLRTVPVSRTSSGGFMPSAVSVSADGTRVALGDWLVDLTTMAVTDLPHTPSGDVEHGYATEIRVVGFTPDGLVYEGAPFTRGFGTSWLLRADGSTVQVDPPEGHISQDDPADLAVDFDYADDNSDTCVQSWVLRDEQWQSDGAGCMGRYLGEALAVSPDHQWLLTDDLPEVWNLHDGSWHSISVPRQVVETWGERWLGRAVWEDADSFLLPVVDQWDDQVPIGEHLDQSVQMVRCTMSTGACERAGDEQDVRVTTTMWGTTESMFAAP